MKILIVGGAVRDMAIGRPPADIDYLVQGATIEEFVQLYPAAKQVGKHFPVFMVDGEEFAFARAEQKDGKGHNGFSVVTHGVTIEDDLERRDLTINAMAQCPETGEVIMSKQSADDLQNKILRHNGDAFREDPLRVFRVARFACTFRDFDVADETIEMMRSMKDGLKELSAERVFGEMKKALDTEHPNRFFEVLRDADCLGTWFPEVEALVGVPAGPDTGKHSGEKDTFHHTLISMLRVPNGHAVEHFAVLCHDLGKALSSAPPKHHGHDKAGFQLASDLCARLKVPNSWRNLALMFTTQHIRMHKILEMSAGKAVRLVVMGEKVGQDGLAQFLACSVGDGMEKEEAYHIMGLASEVFNVSLPKKYYGQGKKCADILHQLRCDAWKEAKLKLNLKLENN